MADGAHSETSPSKASTIAALLLLAVGAGVFLSFSIRLFSDHFANSDIAGITYNTDILLDGGLPYRDTVEYKSPGTFFLFAAIFKLAGRSLTAVQVVFAAWLLIGAWAVWVAAVTLYGRTSRPAGRLAAAGATALYLLSAAQFEYNYSAWMTPAYAWAFTLLLLGLRRDRWYWHLLAGAVAMLALLLKSQAVVLGLVFPVAWLWARWRGEHGAAWHAPLVWVAGAGCAALPLVILYLSHGALPELAAGAFPVAAAREYAARVPLPFPWYELVWKVLHKAFNAFPLAVALLAAAVVGVLWELRRRRGTETRRSEPILPQVVLLIAAVIATGLGGLRFFGHYFIQYVPGLALVAAHPAAYRLIRGSGVALPGRVFGWVVAVACLAAAIPQGDAILWGRSLGYGSRKSNPRARDVAAASDYIRQRTTSDDRIFVWGWAGWPVYFWADRRSPCPIYKELGVVTTFNTNSTFRLRSRPIMFKPGPAADMLVQSFREHPPAYFVHSDHYEKINGDVPGPLAQFKALRTILDRQYTLERVFGGLRVYGHRTESPRPQH